MAAAARGGHHYIGPSVGIHAAPERGAEPTPPSQDRGLGPQFVAGGRTAITHKHTCHKNTGATTSTTHLAAHWPPPTPTELGAPHTPATSEPACLGHVQGNPHGAVSNDRNTSLAWGHRPNAPVPSVLSVLLSRTSTSLFKCRSSCAGADGPEEASLRRRASTLLRTGLRALLATLASSLQRAFQARVSSNGGPTV